MKVSRLFTIDTDIANLLAQEDNASGLINMLLTDYFDTKGQNIEKDLQKIRQERLKIRKKMQEIRQKQAEKAQKEALSSLNQIKLQLDAWRARGFTEEEIKKKCLIRGIPYYER